MNRSSFRWVILGIFVVSFSLLLGNSLHQADGQAATNATLVPYQNPKLGFSLQHPSNWQVDESEASDGIIRFTTPINTPHIFAVIVDDSKPYLDTNTLTLKNNTLQDSVQHKLSLYTLLGERTEIDYRVTRQSDVTVGGNGGIKVEYIFGDDYNFDVYTMANGKLYTLNYKETPLKVPETVPLANKVVESFKILS